MVTATPAQIRANTFDLAVGAVHEAGLLGTERPDAAALLAAVEAEARAWQTHATLSVLAWGKLTALAREMLSGPDPDTRAFVSFLRAAQKE